MEENNTLSFKYIKGPDCKTFFIEGAAGGITPRGNIFLHLYQERRPTPDSVTHEITEDGRLGDIKSSEVHDGLIREIQCGLVLEPIAAAQLLAWLGEILSELREIHNQDSEEDQSTTQEDR